MSRRGYESSLPTWTVITVKITSAIVLLTSIAYLSSCAWAIADWVNTKNSKHSKSDSYEVVILTCYSVSTTSLFIQTITTLGLLFNCTGDIKRHSYRWIIIQSVLLVIVILAYLIPYSFNAGGEHEEISKFFHKTGSHLGDVVDNIKDLKANHPSHFVPYTFFAHVLAVIIGCVLVGVAVALGAKSGYQTVN